MSLICAKKYENKIIVAADTRVCDSDGMIFSECERKIKKIGNDIIIGSCGDVDIMKEFFAYANRIPYTNIPNNVVDCHKFLIEFIKEIKYKNYNITNQTFLFVNKDKIIPMYYTDDNDVFSYDNDYGHCALGSPKEYAIALLDEGYSPQEVIVKSAKRFSNINDKPYVLEVNF